jgi:hypothetical protein
MEDILDREPKTQPKASQREGTVARTIEQQTAKLPSDTFLWAATGSIGPLVGYDADRSGKKGPIHRTMGAHTAHTGLV